MSRSTVPFVILDRHDPARNMARYYVLSIEPSLFGDTALVRGNALSSSVSARTPSKRSRPGSPAKSAAVTFLAKAVPPHNPPDTEAKSNPAASPAN
jgi:hypothetical protein